MCAERFRFTLQTQPTSRSCFFKSGCEFAFFLIVLFSSGAGAAAQSGMALSQVKKVYVEPFGEDSGTAALRDRTIEQLRRKAKLEIVAAPRDADAIIKGSGSVWITGYVSTDPRSPSTTRQPTFQGFLSIEFVGKNDEPLWSYLVTPGAFRTGDVSKDLADRLVDKFLEARQKSQSVQPAQVPETSGQIALTAAGATFPAPLYQKWFETFHESHPSVSVDYSAVGSDAGPVAVERQS
jgi:hypothetical protein